MAKPIISFTLENSSIRYYQIHDTFTGFNHTIPLDLISFLQLYGIRNKEFIYVFFINFQRLLLNGSTIPFCTYKVHEKNKAVFFSEDNDLLGADRLKLNTELEKLFATKNSFNDFYKDYQLLIKNINETLPRPINYYSSISQTNTLLSQPNELKKQFAVECINQFNLGITIEQFFDFCIDKQFILKNKEAVSIFYLKLGKYNLIRIDAIPHVLRKEKNIEQLFFDYGAENLLPQVPPNYDLFSKANIELKAFDDSYAFLQFVNNFSFSELANSNLLQGTELTRLNKDRLLNLLYSHNCFNQSIINFVDQWGNIKQPMVNSSDFALNFNELKSDTDYSIVFLNYFGRQDYRLFNKNGRLITNEGCYDFKLEKYKDVYSLWTHDSKYLCVKYLNELNLLIKKELNEDIFIENKPIDSTNIPVLDEGLFLPDEREQLYKLILFPKDELKNNTIFSEIAFNQFELYSEVNQVAKLNYQDNVINYKGLRDGLIAKGNFHSVNFQETDIAQTTLNISLNCCSVSKYHLFQIIISNINIISVNYFISYNQSNFLDAYNDFVNNYLNDISLDKLNEQLLFFLQARDFTLINQIVLNEDKIFDLLNTTEDELPF